MIKRLLILFCLIIFAISVFLFSSDKPFCRQIANYTIEVKLDTEKKQITAVELLSWMNDSEHSTDELWFHLYWNGFQNNMSNFLKEGKERWGRIFLVNKKEDWGYCRVESIKILKNQYFEDFDLTSSMVFRHPDDDNVDDQTVFSVELPYTIEPGQTILLEIKFQSKVPRPIHRTGVYKDYYFIAQWFPKIGVFYEGKWNCHQFHATSNFFADYGTYDIKITLPSHYVVGASGEHREKILNKDATTSHRFVQHSIHDFGWTASPRFLECREEFEFAPGKRTEIILLLQPYHQNLKERYFNAVKNAIKYCSLWYGDYPYSTVTCVDPAYNSRSGGMEYPTIFTGGTYFLSREGIPRPEGVTIHEFGHGYFYGLVGTNEFEDAWMDEGFTSFLDSEIYYAAYGEPVYSKTYFRIPVTFKEVKIPIESSGISRQRRTHSMDVMQNFTWKFMDRASYSANSYAKAELMLRTLKRFMGTEMFSKMIKAYSQRFWFKHPRPKDFYDVVSEFTGQDMSWFFDQIVHGSGKMDYAVNKIISQREWQPKGWFEGKYKDEERNKSKEVLYLSEVVVRRLGEVKVPVDVLIVFEDGERIGETWDGQYRWKRFVYKRPFQVTEAIVDPKFKLVLDVNRTNNSMMRKSNRLAPLKWTSNWLVWLQHALEFFTIFGG